MRKISDLKGHRPSADEDPLAPSSVKSVVAVKLSCRRTLYARGRSALKFTAYLKGQNSPCAYITCIGTGFAWKEASINDFLTFLVASEDS